MSFLRRDAPSEKIQYCLVAEKLKEKEMANAIFNRYIIMMLHAEIESRILGIILKRCTNVCTIRNPPIFGAKCLEREKRRDHGASCIPVNTGICINSSLNFHKEKAANWARQPLVIDDTVNKALTAKVLVN